MVATVRGIAAQSDSATAGSLEFLGNQADRLDGLFDDTSAPLVEASAMAAEAIGAAFMAYEDDDTLTSHMDDMTGITVAISSVEGTTTYTVDATVSVDDAEVLVGMVGTDSNSSITEVEGDPIQSETGITQTTTTTGNIRMSLAGSASINGGPSLTLGSGTGFNMLMAEVVETVTQTDGGSATTETASLDELSLALKGVVLDQPSGPDFSGSISIAFMGLEAEETNIDSSNGTLTGFVDGIASLGFDSMSFKVAGTVTYVDGSTLKAVVSISSSGYTCESEACDAETDQGYVPMSATVILTSTGDGGASLMVSTSLTRSGLEDVSISNTRLAQGASLLTVTFDPSSLSSEATTQTVVITNRVGVALTLTVSEDSAGDNQYTGTLTYNGETYGTISNATLGSGPEILYTDDTTETIL